MLEKVNGKTKAIILPLVISSVLAGCDATSTSVLTTPEQSAARIAVTKGAVNVLGEVWVDNWFSLYVNGQKLTEDSVPITTERSFNAERFNFKADYPMTFAVELRDYAQNETGLEYIGTNRQQMGDGGAIFQFTNTATRKLIAASNSNAKCYVLQTAPIDASCAGEANPVANSGSCAQVKSQRPENWTASDFDDSRWETATVHATQSVRPKDGYDTIKWNDEAKLIWSSDLVRDNILLCRIKVTQ